jgi:hypothetical protein
LRVREKHREAHLPRSRGDHSDALQNAEHRFASGRVVALIRKVFAPPNEFVYVKRV